MSYTKEILPTENVSTENLIETEYVNHIDYVQWYLDTTFKYYESHHQLALGLNDHDYYDDAIGNTMFLTQGENELNWQQVERMALNSSCEFDNSLIRELDYSDFISDDVFEEQLPPHIQKTYYQDDGNLYYFYTYSRGFLYDSFPDTDEEALLAGETMIDFIDTALAFHYHPRYFNAARWFLRNIERLPSPRLRRLCIDYINGKERKEKRIYYRYLNNDDDFPEAFPWEFKSKVLGNDFESYIMWKLASLEVKDLTYKKTQKNEGHEKRLMNFDTYVRTIANIARKGKMHELQACWNKLPSLQAIKQSNGIFATIASNMENALISGFTSLFKISTALNLTSLSLQVLSFILQVVQMCVNGANGWSITALVVTILGIISTVSTLLFSGFLLNNSVELAETITQQLLRVFENQLKEGEGLNIKRNSMPNLASEETFVKQIHNFTKKHAFSSEQTIKQASLPSLELIITMIVGITGIIITAASMFGNKTASNVSQHIVNGSRLRKALTESVRDTRSFVESIAEEVFDYQISPISKVFSLITVHNEKLVEWLQKTDQYMISDPSRIALFAEDCRKADELYTSVKLKTGEMDNRFVNQMNTLFSDLRICKERLNRYRRLRSQSPVKVEPVAVHIVGRQGAGKTHFITTYLIPEIQRVMKWSNGKYVLDFGGQEFFPPCHGEEIAVVPEFLARGAKDPIIHHMNRIHSREKNNIPGADLWTKEQEWLAKLAIYDSNSHYIPLTSELSLNGEKAVYSRLGEFRYELVNVSIPPVDKYKRSAVVHTPNFSELQIRRYKLPATSTSKIAMSKDDNNPHDEFDIVTKEQMVQQIIDELRIKQQEFEAVSSGQPTVPRVITPIMQIETKVTSPEPVPSTSGITKTPTTPKQPKKGKSIEVTLKKQAEAVDKALPMTDKWVHDRLRRLSKELWTSKELSQSSLEVMEAIMKGKVDMDYLNDIIDDFDLWDAYDAWTSHDTFMRFCRYMGVEPVLEPIQEEEEEQQKAPVEVVTETVEEELPTPPVTEKQNDERGQHIRCLLYGETGTGKTFAARKIAKILSETLQLPVVDVTTQKLSRVVIERKSIILMHDKDIDEIAYVNWYDALPVPCIIVLTSNCEVSTNWITRVKSIKKKYVQTVHPGYARRSGVAGYIYDSTGKQVYVGPQFAGEFQVTGKGIITDKSDSKIKNNIQIAEILYQKYCKQYSIMSDAIITEVDEIRPIPADLTIVADSFADLKRLVTCSVSQALPYLLHEKYHGVSVKLSDRLFNSEYIFRPNLFDFGELETPQDIIEFARRSYAQLREGNPDFIARVEIKDTVKVLAENSVIEYQKTSTMADRVETVSIIMHEGQRAVSIEYADVIKIYALEDIVRALLMGFHTGEGTTIGFRETQIILAHKQLIMSHEMSQPYIIKYRAEVAKADILEHESTKFVSKWIEFKDTVGYKVLLAICVILGAIMAILSVWGMVKLFQHIFKGDETAEDEKELPTETMIQQQKVNLQWELTGNEYSVIVSSGEEVNAVIGNAVIESILASVKDENYTLGSVSYIVKEYNKYDNTKQKNRKLLKERNTKVRTSNELATVKQSKWSTTEVQRIVMSKVMLNQCVLYCGVSTLYGLRWRDDLIIAPSHFVIDDNIPIIAELYLFEGEVYRLREHVPCKMVYMDRDNEIAVFQILDKTIPKCKDVTAYFHDETTISKFNAGALWRRERFRKDVMANALTIHYGSIDINVRSSITPKTIPREHLRFRTLQSNVPTIRGDCGALYTIAEASANTALIVGMHTDKNVDGTCSYGSVISRQLLNRIKKNIDSNVKPTVKQDNTTMNFFEMEHPLKNIPHALDLDVEIVVEDKYYDCLVNDAYEYNVDEGEIWYDAEVNPTSHLLMFAQLEHSASNAFGKNSHERTPFSVELEKEGLLPNLGYPSVVRASQHSNPDVLVKDGTRPDVGLTQIAMYNDEYKWTPQHDALLNRAKDLLFNQYCETYPEAMRPLNHFETINGLYFNQKDGLYSFLEPMDLDTSAGDYCMRFYNIQHKRTLMKEVEIEGPSGRIMYDFADTKPARRVSKLCEEIVCCAIDRKRIFMMARDNFKYEITGKPDKTRIFQSLNIPEIYLIRKFTGTFQATMSKHHLEGHCQVGIDPVREFRHLRRRLLKVGSLGECGDFKRFDKHQNAKILEAAVSIIRDFYKRFLWDKDLNASDIDNIFAVITDIIVNTSVVYNRYLYFKMRGNPSGNPITTVVNSICNDLYHVMAIIHMRNTHIDMLVELSCTDHQTKLARMLQYYGRRFKDCPQICEPLPTPEELVNLYIDWIDMGDDALTIVADEYIWFFNFKTVQKFYHEILSLTYTPMDKESEGELYQQMHEMEFLSRRFLDFPGIKDSTIHNFFHWISSPEKDILVSNIKEALDEAVMVSKEKYEQIAAAALWVKKWYAQRGTELRFVIPSYGNKWQAMNEYIRMGTTKNSLTKQLIRMESSGKDNRHTTPFDSESTTITPKQVIKLAVKQSATTENRMTDFDKIKFFDQLLTQRVSDHLNDLKNITEIRKYPAIVRLDDCSRHSHYFSVGFEVRSVDDLGATRKDFNKWIRTGDIQLIKVTKVTILMGNTIDKMKVIHQLHFLSNMDLTSYPTPDVVLPSKNKKSVGGPSKPLKKVTIQQSAGADETPIVAQEGMSAQTPNALLTQQHRVPKRTADYSLWHRDLKTMAHEYFEADIIITKIGTERGTVLARYPLGDTTGCSAPMQKWASLHEFSNAPMHHEFGFVTASTLVNQLAIGIADEYRATYSIDELQLIQWEAVNPQSDAVQMEVALAATSDDCNLPNRYRFQTFAAPSDTAPIRVPTIVIMTRTLIQNSYANDDVYINMVHRTKFASGYDFMVTSKIMRSWKTPGTVALALNHSVMSDLLSLPKGFPVYMAADGAYTLRKGRKDVLPLTEDTFVGTTNSTSVIVDRSNITTEQGSGTIWINYPASYQSQFYFPVVKTTDITLESLRLRNNNPNSAYLANLRLGNNMFGAGSRVVWAAIGGSKIPAAPGSFKIPTSDNFAEFDQLPILTAYVAALNSNYYGVKWDYTISKVIDETTLQVKRRQYASKTTLTPLFAVNNSGINNAIASTITTISIATPTRPLTYFSKNDMKMDYLVELQHPEWGKHSFVACRIVAPDGNDIVGNGIDDGTWSSEGWTFDGYWCDTHFGEVTAGAYGQAYYCGRLKLIYNCSVDRTLSMEGIPLRAVTVVRNTEATIDATMSRFSFSTSIPKTITNNFAAAGVPCEVDRDYITLAIKNYLRGNVVDTVNVDQMLTFSLYYKLGLTPFAIVYFDVESETFTIKNNPSTDSDRYRAVRKLNAEDVVIGNFGVVERNISPILSTDTSTWINRVVPNQSKLNFDGRAVTKFARKTNNTIMVKQAASILPAVLQGLASGAISAAQFMEFKNQLDLQTKAKLEVMEKQFEYTLANDKELARYRMQLQLMNSGLYSPLTAASFSNGQAGTDTSVDPPSDGTASNDDGESGGSEGNVSTASKEEPELPTGVTPKIKKINFVKGETQQPTSVASPNDPYKPVPLGATDHLTNSELAAGHLAAATSLFQTSSLMKARGLTQHARNLYAKACEHRNTARQFTSLTNDDI